MGCVLLGMGIWVGVYLEADLYLECINGSRSVQQWPLRSRILAAKASVLSGSAGPENCQGSWQEVVWGPTYILCRSSSCQR